MLCKPGNRTTPVPVDVGLLGARTLICNSIAVNYRIGEDKLLTVLKNSYDCDTVDLPIRCWSQPLVVPIQKRILALTPVPSAR